jgi:hypothetical protein
MQPELSAVLMRFWSRLQLTAVRPVFQHAAVFAERSQMMNPYTNPPSPEPTRVEIQYRLTPEQEQVQRRIRGQVRGMRRIIGVFALIVLAVILAVAGVVVFVIVHLAASFPLQ